MPEKKWTKKELSLRSGIKELAQAVLEQWVKDGKPKDPGIRTWQDIYLALVQMEAKPANSIKPSLDNILNNPTGGN